jgi:hypothetical protein
VLEVYPFMQYAPFISNHDIDRVFDQLGRNRQKMKLAASLYLTMPGVPFIYYGEEIGMLGSGPDPEKRKPMQWNSQANAGFTSGQPWKAPNSNYGDYNVATLSNEPNSMWNQYRKLVQSRNRFEVLRKGYTTVASTGSNPDAFAFVRHLEAEAVLTVANLGTSTANITINVASSLLQPNSYVATDLITGEILDTIEVPGNGAINWDMDMLQPSPRSTRIIRLAEAPTEVVANLPQTACDCKPDEIRLAPNPADNQVTITMDGDQPSMLQFYSLDGKLIKRYEVDNANLTVNISDMPAGIYVVEAVLEEKVLTKKLMVK